MRTVRQTHRRSASSTLFAPHRRRLLRRLLALLAIALASRARAQDLAAARSAFMQQRFDDAERAYRAVFAGGAPEDRYAAALGLADIAGRVRGDTLVALTALRPYLDRSAALASASRARLGVGDAAGAFDAARAALAAAHNADDHRDAAVALGDAALAPAEATCLDRTRDASSEPDAQRVSADLRLALDTLRAVALALPGRLDVAERLMRAAALARDWSALSIGWASYFGGVERTPGGAVARADGELRAAARGRAVGARHAVAALEASRLYEPAAAIANCGPASARVAGDLPLAAYATYLRTVGRATAAYYRDIALARGDPAAWQRALRDAGAQLWREIAPHGAPYDPDSLLALVDRRYGLVTNVGRTAGTLDLHAGHRLTDDHRVVRQYGHAAPVRFIQLDAMVSDGYQTWAWGGRPAHGGWANAVAIYQVRPVYAEGPLRAWRAVTDSVIVAADSVTIARDSVADAERARRGDDGYFPSVRERMTRAERRALLVALSRVGRAPLELEAEFTRAYGSTMLASSIFAHEGRHAIDRAMGLASLGAPELEYRAKLSEVAFAPSPRLALAGILDATTGDASPHGAANARLQRGLLDWMARRPAGRWPPDVPLVLLIPRLTDDELRAAARSLDPFAAQH